MFCCDIHNSRAYDHNWHLVIATQHYRLMIRLSLDTGYTSSDDLQNITGKNSFMSSW